MKNKTKISRFLITASFVILAIGFNANTIFGQHPCDTFVNTCNIPSAFANWSLQDTVVSSTGQVGEPVPHTFYTIAQNPLKTNWYHWTAPTTGTVVVTTKDTNPNATAATNWVSPYVIDSVISIYTGSTISGLTRISQSDDWNLPAGNPDNTNCFTIPRPGSESILSSCTKFVVTAGTTYHFQVDDLTRTSPTIADFYLNLYYLAPLSSSVTVGGRITDDSGRAIGKVRVSLTKSNGEILSATTNAFGYYNFEGVEVGQTYTLQATSKRFQFQNNPRVISVNENIQNEDFVSVLE